jgi:hypothetical protein
MKHLATNFEHLRLNVHVPADQVPNGAELLVVLEVLLRPGASEEEVVEAHHMLVRFLHLSTPWCGGR